MNVKLIRFEAHIFRRIFSLKLTRTSIIFITVEESCLKVIHVLLCRVGKI